MQRAGCEMQRDDWLWLKKNPNLKERKSVCEEVCSCYLELLDSDSSFQF